MCSGQAPGEDRTSPVPLRPPPPVGADDPRRDLPKLHRLGGVLAGLGANLLDRHLGRRKGRRRRRDETRRDETRP